MAELRALCAGCRKPLSGQLVANSCNHVFHRDCLHAAEGPCGRCEQPLDEENALSLFGLGFEGVDDAASIAVMAAIAEIKPEADLVSSDEEADAQAPANSANSREDLTGLGSSREDLTGLGSSREDLGGDTIDLDADIEEILDEVAGICGGEGGVAADGPAATQLDGSQDGTQPAAAPETAVDSTGDASLGPAAPVAATAKSGDVPPPAALAAPSQEAVADVARICLLRQRARRRAVRQEAERERLRAARAALKEQQEKLSAAQRVASKREAAAAQAAAQINEVKERCEKISIELNQVRQRDAVLEYWEEMRNKGPQEALTFLTRTVNLVGNSWKILTQVARLRDHHRKQLDTFDKESAQAVMREQRAKRDLAEMQKSVSELKAKIQQQRQLLPPAAVGGRRQVASFQDSLVEAPALKRHRQ